MKMAPQGDGLTISAQTLRKRLHEQGFLIREGKRETLKTRRMIEGALRNVLHLRSSSISISCSDIPDIPSISPLSDTEEADSGLESDVRSKITTGQNGHSLRIPPAIRELFEERAATLQIDGGMTKEEAERAALVELTAQAGEGRG